MTHRNFIPKIISKKLLVVNCFIVFNEIFSDVDECAVGTHDCQQVCTNIQGSFSCSCKSGFLMNGDKKTCTGDYHYLQSE